MKRIKISLALGFALVLTLIYCPTGSQSAGDTRTVDYNLSVEQGEKHTYYTNNLGGYRNISSLTVTTSKKSCATVKKSGKKSFTITGKSVGSAKVTATIKLKKAYSLKKIYKYVIKVEVYKKSVDPISTPTSTSSPAPTEEPTTSPSPSPAVSYTFRYPDRLTEHFNKHGKEMGFATEEEYLAAANAVIVNPAALHKLEAEDNDHVYFVEATGEIVFLSQDGYIRTFFLTDKAYFDRT